MGTNAALSRVAFQQNLAFGQLAETDIARWLMRVRGASLLPIYDIEYDTGKGPRVFAPNRQLVAPDLLVFSDGRILWIEAKHKTVFSWHRKTARWVTGIDRHHYRNYLAVAQLFGLPVWILFLHKSDKPHHRDREHGCPDACPVGLFGGDVDSLKDSINHEHDNHGVSGMVYWAHDTLKLLATVNDVCGAVSSEIL